MNKLLKNTEKILLLLSVAGILWQKYANEELKAIVVVPLLLLSILYFGFSLILFKETAKAGSKFLTLLSGVIYSVAVLAILYKILAFSGANYLLIFSGIAIATLLSCVLVIRNKKFRRYNYVHVFRLVFFGIAVLISSLAY